MSKAYDRVERVYLKRIMKIWDKLHIFENDIVQITTNYVKTNRHLTLLRLRLDPLFWECILENAFSIMYFVENSVFGKILKLFIRSDYVEKNYIWLVF